MENNEIEILVSKTAAGDMTAFETLYQTTNQRVYFICLNLLKSKQDAEDALQDTYLIAFKNIRQLSEPQKFVPWVERIAVNRCKDIIKKSQPVPVDDDILKETLLAEDEFTIPEKYIVNREKRRILMDIMRTKLTDLQYQTIILYYFNNLSVAEIAEIMECSEGAVKNRLSKARASIKKAIDEIQEGKDDKLFTFVGVPFLAKVFDEESKTLTAPALNTSMFTGQTVSSASNTSVSGTVNTAVSGAVKTGVKTISKKVLIGIVAGVVAAGGITTAVIVSANHQKSAIQTDNSAVGSVSQNGSGDSAVSGEEPQDSSVQDESSAESSIESDNDTESKDDYETVSDEESTESSENESKAGGYWLAEIGDSGTCGENVTWELRQNGELVISGSGNMYDYSSKDVMTDPKYPKDTKFTGHNIKKVTIEKGVSSIGDNAFHGFAAMTSITIPNSVTKIGDSAFEYCEGLTGINIPDSVTSIGNTAFFSCIKLKDLHISNSITKIGYLTFESCERLSSITIPDGVTSIGDMAFKSCDRLTNITIPNSVTSIGKYAFQYCPVLTSVTIPDGVTTIDNGAFEDCELLTNITIPDSVTTMGDFVFSDTLWYEKQPDGVVYAGKVAYGYKGDEPSDTNIVLKDDTVGIAGNAFYLETWITSMTVPESVKSIGFEAFENYTDMVMYVKSGSYAESYAKEEGIKFVAK